MDEVLLLYFVRYIHGYMKSSLWGLFAKVVNGLEAVLQKCSTTSEKGVRKISKETKENT